MLTPQRKSETATATLRIGAAPVAITCCAGLPAICALLGGLTLGAVLGLGLDAPDRGRARVDSDTDPRPSTRTRAER